MLVWMLKLNYTVNLVKVTATRQSDAIEIYVRTHIHTYIYTLKNHVKRKSARKPQPLEVEPNA